MERAQKFMAKYGIGAALIYNHDRRRYISYPWNHPYAKQVPAYFALLIRDAGFPYLSLHEGIDAEEVKKDTPWLEGRILRAEELVQPRTYRYMTPEIVASSSPPQPGRSRRSSRSTGWQTCPFPSILPAPT